MKKFCAAFFALCALCAPVQQARAQSPGQAQVQAAKGKAPEKALADARRTFRGGDIPAAAKQLEAILTPVPRVQGPALEDAQKLFGVCKYLLGDQQLAQRIFAAVLARNPAARLNRADLLDPGIEPFYFAARGKGGQAPAVANGAAVPRPQAPAAASQAPVSASQAPGAEGRKARVDFTGELPPPRGLASMAPGVPQGPSLAAEFMREAAGPPPAGPPPASPAPRPVPRVPASRSPVMPSPAAPQLGMPPQAQGVSPTVAPQPGGAVSPGMGAGSQGQPLQQPQAPLLYPQNPAPRGKSFGLALLPFGIGQFQNDHFLKGVGFLVVGAGALGYAIERFYEDSSYRTESKRYLDANPNAAGREAYIVEVATYLKNVKTERDIALVAFAAAWGLGIFDAVYYFAPTPTGRPVPTVGGAPWLGFRPGPVRVVGPTGVASFPGIPMGFSLSAQF